ncbi:MAG TPA: hypothetical protein VGK90_01530 [Rhizomicrobium sp.]|jgi:ABC-2 type transport system permease protein
MSTQSNTMADTASATQDTASSAFPSTRIFAWSVRRELWEYRSTWIAPLAAAGFVMLGFVISLVRISGVHMITNLPPDKQMALRLVPYGIAMAAVTITSVIVGISYCLGTLYNERRDRSILFWKSMPVSDLMTVLAKASVPMIVLPLIAFVVICATQLIMLPLHAATLAARGQDAGSLFVQVPLLRSWLLLFYSLVTLALWYAPIYGWLFMLSSWVKRGPFLWAVLPVVAISVVEQIAFNTSYFVDLVKYRLGGSFHEAFVDFPHHHSMGFQWPTPDPVRFFSSPGLWLGLVVAVFFFGVTVWMRRRREPV